MAGRGLAGTEPGLSLLVPVGAMIASLNLQGYIVASTGSWMGVPVYVPLLARFAAPGALFDPIVRAKFVEDIIAAESGRIGLVPADSALPAPFSGRAKAGFCRRTID